MHTRIAALALIAAASAFAATTAPPAIKLAVFDFRLNDTSAAGAASMSDSAADQKRMQAVSDEARRVLAQSGRYSVVGAGAGDADAARQLGAQQSLAGVITRVAATEYYVSMTITDVHSGKALFDQTAFFTGADDAWASGVRLMLRHEVLAEPGPQARLLR